MTLRYGELPVLARRGVTSASAFSALYVLYLVLRDDLDDPLVAAVLIGMLLLLGIAAISMVHQGSSSSIRRH